MNNKSKIIVFDVNIPQFMNNQILNYKVAEKYPGASVMPLLRVKALNAGWDMLTADVFLKRKPTFDQAVCLSNEATPMLKELIKSGVIPKVLASGESPNVALDFYHKLGSLSKPFIHTALFRGMSSRCKAKNFHHWYWPCVTQPMLTGCAWAHRKLICMVVSPKSKISINWGRWQSIFMGFPRMIHRQFIETMDRLMRVKDLYSVRLSAIEQFASREGFVLSGYGWDNAIANWPRLKKIKFQNKPLICENKIELMAGFRFALCFENCSFPGYITEKVFDCFFAGCVPVYYGPPDITDFIPKQCFIDFRDFESFDHLWEFLREMQEERWNLYRMAILEFLNSDLFVPFKQETVADNLLRWLIKES